MGSKVKPSLSGTVRQAPSSAARSVKSATSSAEPLAPPEFKARVQVLERFDAVIARRKKLLAQEAPGSDAHRRLKAEIEGVIDAFRARGLLFCTTHFVQDHCTIEELTFAYDLVYELVRRH